jgi:hypothetical protein
MPWLRNDPPDPLEAKRRELEEQQRLLAERMSELHEQLHGKAPPEEPVEPPVWRMEDDSHAARALEANARKRNLARQRQSDMILWVICFIALLVAVAIFLWLRAHYASLNTSA